MPGPIPKRSTERRRRNKATASVTTVPVAAPTLSPPPTPANLHPIAARWFDSLRESGQSKFYEPSDWAAAEFVAFAMSKTLNARRFSAISFSATWSAMTDLLTTEGARRRARMEIEREVEAQPVPPGITALQGYRKAAAQ